MLVGPMPPRGERLTGGFMLHLPDGQRTIYVHGLLEHDLEPVLLLELVDRATFATRALQPPPRV